MKVRNAAMLAVPLVVLAACAGRYQESATPDPSAVSRESQVEACANQLASQTARPRAEIQAFYDRDGVGGNAMVNVSGATGTFQCEVDDDLNVVRLTRTGAETPATG